MTALKLIAFDQEDLTIVSAHLQDAVVRVGDMAFLPRDRRFVALLNRFDWSTAEQEATGRAVTGAKTGGYSRLRAALRFEHVLRAKVLGVALNDQSQVLSLLAIEFTPVAAPGTWTDGAADASAPDDPGGTVTLRFAGGAAASLEVECIEAELRDLGPAWRTRFKPDHSSEDDGDVT